MGMHYAPHLSESLGLKHDYDFASWYVIEFRSLPFDQKIGRFFVLNNFLFEIVVPVVRKPIKITRG